MDLAEIEIGVARLDAAFRPAAEAPVDISEPDWMAKLAAAHATPLVDRLGLRAETESVLRPLLHRYATGDETTRVAIRALFNRYTSFRWAAHLPRGWHTAAEFRDELLHFSARDQGPDTRDELLALDDLCGRARKLGLAIAPILTEVAALSSDIDRYGMGSTRQILLGRFPRSGLGRRA